MMSLLTAAVLLLTTQVPQGSRLVIVDSFSANLAGTSAPDGMVLRLRGEDQKTFSDVLAPGPGWKRSNFSGAVQSLQANGLKHNFLEVRFGDRSIDLFDDLAWRELASRLTLAATVCREASLEGIWLRLGKLRALCTLAQDKTTRHTREEYVAQARVRGKQTMEAMLEGQPKLTIVAPNFLSELTRAYDSFGKPAVRPNDEGDLLPAFADGWLDAATGTTNLIVGAPASGSSRADFLEAAQRSLGFDSQLVSPEVRDRYRARVQFAAHVSLTGEASQSLSDALSVSGKYVWVEDSPEHPWDKEPLSPTTQARTSHSLVSTQAPAFNPSRLANPLETLPNMVQNPGIVGSLGWQSNVSVESGLADMDASKGRVKPGSLHLQAISRGSWIQEISVQPGTSWALRAASLTAGLAKVSLEIGWKGRDEKLLPDSETIAFLPADASGWQTIIGRVDVPVGAARMCIRLTMLSPGGRADEAWFDDIRAVAL